MLSKRFIPWLLTFVFLAAFTAAFSELQRVKTRLSQVSRHNFHDHTEVRRFMIRAALDDTISPIVVIGDSITEMSPLPASACGHPVVNAGIGGAGTLDFIQIAPVLFEGRPRPYLIVVALGANDIGSGNLTHDFSALLSALSDLTPRIVVVSNTSDEGVLLQQRAATSTMRIPYNEVRVTGLMSDRIHFTRAGYSEWMPVVLQAMSIACEDHSAALR